MNFDYDINDNQSSTKQKELTGELHDTVINNTNENKSRNLKSFAVKLPEEIIEEIEKLYEASGLRFKNEFMEYLIKQYKVNLLKEGKHQEELLHPEIVKTMSGDVHELGKLTQMINQLFINQLEKISVDRYEVDKLKNKNETLQKQNIFLNNIINENIKSQKRKENFVSEYLINSLETLRSNFLYVGTSGSGKSHAAKLEIKKAIKQGKQVIVIDPQGEYQNLTRKLGGTNFKLFNNEFINLFEYHLSKNQLENLDESKNAFTIKILEVSNIIETIIERSFNAQERMVVLNCIEEVYKNVGITRNSSTENKKVPTLSDLEVSLRHSGSIGLNIADELEPFINGRYKFLNNQRNFKIYKSPILTFNLNDCSKTFTNVSYYIALDFILTLLKTGIFEDTLLVVDEFWAFTQTKQSTDFLLKTLGEMKQLNIDTIFVTQAINDIDKNFNYDFLRKIQNVIHFKTHSIENLDSFYYLSDEEKKMIETLKIGEAFVFTQGNNKTKFYIKYPEDKDASTKPEDIVDDYLI